MDPGTLAYNQGHNTTEEYFMPKGKKLVREKKGVETFGERLARLRENAGYSLRELARELGISPRMLVYYEKHADHHQADLWPKLANVLGVSSDQLFGIEKTKENSPGRDTKLWRRFNQIEKLPSQQRRPIVQVIDAFLEREKLKKTG